MRIQRRDSAGCGQLNGMGVGENLGNRCLMKSGLFFKIYLLPSILMSRSFAAILYNNFYS